MGLNLGDKIGIVTDAECASRGANCLPGHYVVTEFDTPTEGDIQQKMYKSADDTLVITYTTEFDKPTEGDITETVETADGEVYNEKITEFDSPTAGDITETASEVI